MRQVNQPGQPGFMVECLGNMLGLQTMLEVGAGAGGFDIEGLNMSVLRSFNNAFDL